VLILFEPRLSVLVHVLFQRVFDVSADLAVFLAFDLFDPLDELVPRLIGEPRRVTAPIRHGATPPVSTL